MLRLNRWGPESRIQWRKAMYSMVRNRDKSRFHPPPRRPRQHQRARRRKEEKETSFCKRSRCSKFEFNLIHDSWIMIHTSISNIPISNIIMQMSMSQMTLWFVFVCTFASVCVDARTNTATLEQATALFKIYDSLGNQIYEPHGRQAKPVVRLQPNGMPSIWSARLLCFA